MGISSIGWKVCGVRPAGMDFLSQDIAAETEQQQGRWTVLSRTFCGRKERPLHPMEMNPSLLPGWRKNNRAFSRLDDNTGEAVTRGPGRRYCRIVKELKENIGKSLIPYKKQHSQISGFLGRNE